MSMSKGSISVAMALRNCPFAGPKKALLQDQKPNTLLQGTVGQ